MSSTTPPAPSEYLFYASDGDNSIGDHAPAEEALADIATKACFTGYVEVASGLSRQLATEAGRLFSDAASNGQPVASYVIDDFENVWDAER